MDLGKTANSKASNWFDFSKNETLSVESIVRSAFENPGRKDFSGEFKWAEIFTDHENPEYLLDRVASEIPSSRIQFDAAQIGLHDTSTFKEKDRWGSKIDKNFFVEEIKISSWHGPYK